MFAIKNLSRLLVFHHRPPPPPADQVEPSSPQPSVDRLSVTFAISTDQQRDVGATGGSEGGPPPPQSPPSTSFDFGLHSQTLPPRRRTLTLDNSLGYRTPDMRRGSAILDSEDIPDDDYSASACAIIQRRNSSRRHSRRKRRPSSPFGPETNDSGLRRRSSVFTTSSGDTAISMEELAAEEQIFENVKLHKEVLSGVKQQPWPLRKKLKLVRQAKAYVRKHEGALQERLAQSRSTKDVLARASILITKKWQYFKREVVNFKTVLIPWERRIKQIESQFGSAVASYFIFLRWLFWFNIVLSAALVTFVALPELLATLQNATIAGERKIMLPEEKQRSNHLLTLWEFEGNLKYSPFFYGWYSNKHTYKAYKLPLAYFVVNLIVYTYSFVAILRKMAKNSRMSKLSEKEDECVFSWKLFSGWDFMIGNAETAQNRIGSIVLGFKEALLEESEKHRDARNWKITSVRVMVNLLVIAMFVISAYVVVEIVDRSENVREVNSSWWRQNEITVVLTLITYIFPIFFEVLGMIERYHPRKQLRLQLGRIMILNLLNMYSLIYALFKKINSSGERLQSLKPNDSVNETSCETKIVPCETNTFHKASALAAMSLVLTSNLSTTTEPLVSRPAEIFFSTEKTNYSLVLDTNVTRDGQFPLHSFDMNNYFSNWTADEYESTSEYPFDNFTAETNNTELPPGMNVLKDKDENTILMEQDHYPHVDYDDYGFPDNQTFDLYEPSSSPGPGEEEIDYYATVRGLPEDDENDSYSTVRGLPVDEDTTAKSKAVTKIPSSCDEFGRIVRCYERTCETKTMTSDNFSVPLTLDLKTKRQLQGLCWETMFGQELAKLTVMDLVLTILSIMGIDFFRAIFVRYMNSCWCWDLEKQFPQYGDFKIAENILHLVNNQGMVWMGIFFSPGLIVLNVIKLVILMYLRSWTVLTCNVPHEVVFRASRSNNFYLALLLTMLFLCVLPVGYAIVWVEPSWHCGPFSGYTKIYHIATSSLRSALPDYIHQYRILDYISSPGIVIPLIVLMTLIIYYMVSLTNSLRESNNDLKIQLRKERTEERRKMFKIAERRLEKDDTPFARWKKILPNPTIVKANDVPTPLKNIRANNHADKKERKRSDDAELTEGEQDSLPNDQVTPSKEITVQATVTDKKNGWRNSKAKELDDYATIPKIRISIEEASGSPKKSDLLLRPDTIEDDNSQLESW